MDRVGEEDETVVGRCYEVFCMDMPQGRCQVLFQGGRRIMSRFGASMSGLT